MKWNKIQRKLIEEEIELYEKGIELGFYPYDYSTGEEFPLHYCKLPLGCVFCWTYDRKEGCKGCPNVEITKLLELEESCEGSCYVNKDYFVEHFNLKTSEEEAEFRKLMWERTLGLTQNEWLEIYNKR